MSKHKTQEEYIQEVYYINKNIEVLGQYVNSNTLILHKCKIDDYQWKVTPDHILHGHGCPVCAGKVIGPGPDYKNSIWSSKYREYFSQYMTEQQMKEYTPQSAKKVTISCPTCGRCKTISVYGLYNNGLGCICNDGVSYPNKFVYALLNQLNINYVPEYCPSWSKNKRYDIFIPSINCIIENNGLQHYEYTGFKRTFQEEQENDCYKQQIAIKNGIEYYICLDCRQSNIEWIKKSILSSQLPKLINFNENQINWNKCDIFATASLIKIVAEWWNDGLDISEIVTKTNLCRHTIRKYLIKATLLGCCEYCAKESLHRTGIKHCGADHARSRKIVQCDCSGQMIKVWNSIREPQETLHINNIFACCKGKQKTAGGFKWQYVD